MLDQDLYEVQRLYPMIYIACHTDLESTPSKTDRRRRDLRLTPLGAKAMASTSVLDATRVQKLLALLTPEERKAAVNGLTLLAKAARQLDETK